MIRLVCLCGKHLRARDEESLRHAVCPACGCPVSNATVRDDEPVPRQKPLTMKDGPLDGMGYVLVPLWEEGQARAKDVPRYEVVLTEKTTKPTVPTPSRRAPVDTLLRKRQPRQRTRRPDGALRAEHPVASILGLTFLLWVVVSSTCNLVNIPSPDSWSLKLTLAGLLLLLVANYCCGFWMVVFRTMLRGEDHVIVRFGLASSEVVSQMMRCLVCFLAGPVFLIGTAAWYWFHAGDLTWVDYALLGELLVAALLYWFFASLAVAADDSLLSAVPSGIVELFRRLGWKKSLVAFVVVLVGILLIIGNGIYAVTTLFDSSWSWLLLLLSCLALQVFLSVFCQWLGAECFLANRARKVREQETACIDSNTRGGTSCTDQPTSRNA